MNRAVTQAMTGDVTSPGAARRTAGAKVGILALQGASARHAAMLARLGVEPIAVRSPADLDSVDVLVLPGGESTTMSMLLESSGLFPAVAERLAGGMPALGTCAGMILLASEIVDGRPDQRCFDVLDMAVRRNAFGRQVDSFEADLDVPALPGGPIHAVFIRAPVVERVADEVEVLATVDGRPVLCRQGPVVAAAFHPELGDDPRLHELFLRGCVEDAAGPSGPAPEAPRAEIPHRLTSRRRSRRESSREFSADP